MFLTDDIQNFITGRVCFCAIVITNDSQWHLFNEAYIHASRLGEFDKIDNFIIIAVLHDDGVCLQHGESPSA